MHTGVQSNIIKAISLNVKSLIPKGEKSIPVRVTVSDGVLSLLVRGVCTYTTSIKVDSDESVDVTVNYMSIAEYIDSSAVSTLEVTPSGLKFESEGFTSFMVPAYSTIDSLEMPEVEFKSLENSSLVSAMHTLASSGLDGLYKKSVPIEVYNGIAILKYPNIMVQLRAPVMDIKFAMTTECARIVQSFAPKEYAVVSSDTIAFKSYNSILLVPIKIVPDGISVKDVIYEDGFKLRFDTEGFLNKLSTLRKLGIDRSEIILNENSVTVRNSVSMSSIEITLGNGGKYVTAFNLPTELLYIIFRLVGNAFAELVYKEGVLCLRTQTIAIATHVLS